MKGSRGKKYGIVLAFIAIVGGFFVYSYTSRNNFSLSQLLNKWVFKSTASNVEENPNIAEDQVEEEIPEEIEIPNPTATILAVGDVMMHDGQIWAGYDESIDTFDYSEFFHVVKDEISKADMAMADLETTFGGKEQKYTGYPMFNSPDELADALKDAGFELIITSNNHCLDRGVKGALRTIKVLKERGLIPIGTYESEEEREQILIKEINDIKTAFLSYTYGTNGIPIPKDKQYLVNLIDKELILDDLTKARQEADAIVVYLHFGEEYQRTPSKAQKELAELVLENGANIVVASHPHVIQPGEWVEFEDLDGEMVKRYIAYSMGNFISAQRFPHTEEGLMVKFTLEKDRKEDKVYLVDVTEINTWVDKFVRDGKMRYVVRYGKKPQ